jgi:hypothetical protein
MTRFHHRLAALERALEPRQVEVPVSALALETGGDDLMLAGQEWVRCPDIAPILARRNPAVKVYLGFAPEEL